MNTTKLAVRGLDYHIQEWGDPNNPSLFLLHGWMDCGASFKFVAECLQDDFHVVAPDLRGFGNTQHANGYWFPDYFADLEVILNHYAPARPVNLLGHSMGGNIVLHYAGIQPERVRKVMSLESLGAVDTKPEDAVDRYRRWLREIGSDEPSRIYPNEMMFRNSLRKGNPALNEDMITELVELWGERIDDSGAMRLKHDHAHRYTNPVRYNFSDTLAIWREIRARVGIVMAQQSRMYHHFQSIGRIAQARELLAVADADYTVIEESAHMLHLEQPQATAQAIRAFFGG